jgi:glycosyltransferase involved in cell wall biosynthesis
MRVLHVHSGNLYGGVETFLLTLARCRGMAPSMETTVALCFEGRIAEGLRAEQVRTPMLGEVRLRRPDMIWRARQALTSILERERYDVVVCHQAWPLAIFGSTVKAAGIPLVSWVHMAQTGRHWLDRLAGLTQPDLFICNSRFTASVMPKTSARVEIVYYPVIPGLTAEAPGGATAGAAGSRGSAGARDPRDTVIIQVSRMEAWKGQRVCLEALGRLRELPGWSCLQVGGAQRPIEQRYLDLLRHDAARLGIADRVQFLGHRSDVAELLASADVFCQPNIGPEPFGISFVEALYAGLPVVSSAIGGALEIVDDTCGALVPPGDVAGVASALSRLIGDRAGRERLGRRGAERARTLCDPHTQMTEIAAALERVSIRRAVVH